MGRSAVLALFLIFLPLGVAGQVVVGRAVDDNNGTPLRGAFVTLSDEEGVPSARSMTDPTGRFTLRAPSGGQYHVRVEYIGYRPTEQGPVTVESGRSAEVVIRLPHQAIPLEGITVSTESRCEIRPETGRLTARLWDDVGTALRIARWSQGRSLLRFRIATWERELDPDRLTVVQEDRDEQVRALNRAPYASAPAEELRELGYVRDAGRQGFTFSAPDADVLLSDAFLDTHCFRARVDDPPEEGWIGLAFEPVKTSSLTDVLGVLWVDAATSELRRLDYRYTRLPGDLADLNSDRIGGQVRFDRVPEGPWILTRWMIRIPRAEIREIRGLPVAQLAAIHEEGAEVLEMLEAADASRPWIPITTTLEGVVYDSVAGEPVAGALVRLTGTNMRAMADERGRFRLQGIPEGSYDVTFESPRLARLPWTPSLVPVEVREREATRVALAIPPLERVLAEGCMVTVDDPGLLGERWLGSGVLVGRAEPADGSSAPPNARVMVTWDVYDVTPAGTDIRVASEHRAVQTGLAADGRFSVCGLPDGASLTIRAEVDGSLGPPETVVLARGEIHPIAVTTPANTSGALRGTVVESGSGEPIVNASVLLVDSNDRVVARTTTDGEGSFSLGNHEPGSYRVRAERLGYDDVESGAMALSGEAAPPALEILMDPRPVELEPLTVTTEARLNRNMVGFLRRQTSGFGSYIGPEDIERRNAVRASDLLLSQPGFRTRGGLTRQEIRVRSGNAGGPDFCEPAVYVDGFRNQNATDHFDSEVPVSSIRAIEVYQEPHQSPHRPPALGRAPCAVIVIWTDLGLGR